jgi:hypothetical protein
MFEICCCPVCCFAEDIPVGSLTVTGLHKGTDEVAKYNRECNLECNWRRLTEYLRKKEWDLGYAWSATLQMMYYMKTYTDFTKAYSLISKCRKCVRGDVWDESIGVEGLWKEVYTIQWIQIDRKERMFEDTQTCNEWKVKIGLGER